MHQKTSDPGMLSGQRLYLLAFIEGAIVMSVELLGGKIIAPYFGSSFYVWMTVIGVTLLSLTSGYFIGGLLARKKEAYAYVYRLFIFCLPAIAMMPLLAEPILYFTYRFGFFFSLIASVLLLLCLPLVLLGSTSPLLIHLIARSATQAGKAAGQVYAVSTIGGILSTFILGFFLLPSWGIKVMTLTITGLLLTSVLLILYRKTFLKLTVSATLLLGLQCSAIILDHGILFKTIYRIIQGPYELPIHVKKQFESEGIMGQLRVMDYYNDTINQRALMINGITQTLIENEEDPYSHWQYVHAIASVSSLKRGNGRVLLFGLGGGSLAQELVDLGLTVDAVDIDGRIPEIARDYFYLDDASINFHIDDARHFIRTNRQRYDLVIFDMASAEVQPVNLFTWQCFSEIKAVLNEDAMVIVNFQGYITGQDAQPFKSILKTLRSIGFHTYHWYMWPGHFTDIYIYAGLDPIPFDRLTPDNLNPCCRDSTYYFLNHPFVEDTIDLSAGLVLDDDLPVLDRINTKAIVNWRKSAIMAVIRENIRGGIGLFD